MKDEGDGKGRPVRRRSKDVNHTFPWDLDVPAFPVPARPPGGRAMMPTIAARWAMASPVPVGRGIPTRELRDRVKFLWLRSRQELEVACGSQ